MKIRYLIICITIFGTSIAFAQKNLATLQGKIVDVKTGQGVIGAYVKLIQNGEQKDSAFTNFEGVYSIVTEPGVYDVEVSYPGLYSQLTMKMNLYSARISWLNVKMKENKRNRNKILTKDYNTLVRKKDYATAESYRETEYGNFGIDYSLLEMMLDSSKWNSMTRVFLRGKISYEKCGKDAIGVHVKLLQDGKPIASDITDWIGDYSIMAYSITYGMAVTYDIAVACDSCRPQLIKNVIVTENAAPINIKMKKSKHFKKQLIP